MDSSVLGYHVSNDLDILTPQGRERAARAYAYVVGRAGETPSHQLRQ